MQLQCPEFIFGTFAARFHFMKRVKKSEFGLKYREFPC